MANSDAKFGFRPVSKDGSPYNGGTFKVAILADDTTATFIGDAVTIDGRASGVYPGVTQSTVGDDVYGVITSFVADPATSLDDQYRKASTLRFANCVSVIDQEFEAQQDGDLVAADAGLNASFIVAAGDTAYGISGMEIDSTTEATTNTLDLQLVRGVDREDNDITGTTSNWIVRFNTPTQAQNSVTGRTGVA